MFQNTGELYVFQVYLILQAVKLITPQTKSLGTFLVSDCTAILVVLDYNLIVSQYNELYFYRINTLNSYISTSCFRIVFVFKIELLLYTVEDCL